jgi:hypothetical protein
MVGGQITDRAARPATASRTDPGVVGAVEGGLPTVAVLQQEHGPVILQVHLPAGGLGEGGDASVEVRTRDEQIELGHR